MRIRVRPAGNYVRVHCAGGEGLSRTGWSARRGHDRLTASDIIVLMIGTTGFPNGSGAAARFRAYSKGLLNNGANVRVLSLLILTPGDSHDVNSNTKGVWEGVEFEHMSGTSRGQEGWWRRRVLELRAARRTIAAIRDAARSCPRTAVVFSGFRLRWILPVCAACKIARVPLLHDVTESPFVYQREPGFLAESWHRASTPLIHRCFDGGIAITSYLEDYLRARMRSDALILRIPILVDPAHFKRPVDPIPGLVGYAGSLEHAGEIESVIDAVATVSRKHPQTHARIMGYGSEPLAKALEAYAQEQGVAGRVEFAGPIPADRLPDALCECSVLVLPRADGLFSKAGMPTKIGEYLATGRPVVVTRTGDIPSYLHDGVDAYLVPPHDSQAFAEAVEVALFDPSAMAVGREGQLSAQREFDATRHMERLLATLEPAWKRRNRLS